jgi:hypothetical protein
MRGKVTVLLIGVAVLSGVHSTRAAPASVDCWQCASIPTGMGGTTCSRTYHQDAVDDYTTLVDASGIQHNFAECPCVTAHGTCNVPGFNPELLSVAVEVSNRESIASVLREFPTAAQMDAKESVIDIFDCEGKFIGRLALQPDLSRSVEEILAE